MAEKKTKSVAERKNEALKDLFNAVTDTDIFFADALGKLYLDGQELSTGEIISLGQEVRDFKDSRLYKVLYNTVKTKAMRTMFDKALTFDDMVSGKMLLLALDLHEKIMQSVTREYHKFLKEN
jgi:hypothetical protein